uniref:DUF7768 domain-containing protein n=1 Tax=viral metagenome TaxID=1070528 RepID=A0A6M3L853_9ZZZZ
MSVVYICHPYSDDPAGNRERALEWARSAVDDGHTPICVHAMMHHYMDEDTERCRIMDQCLDLVACSDELWVCAGHLSAGMWDEVSYAHACGVHVKVMVEFSDMEKWPELAEDFDAPEGVDEVFTVGDDDDVADAAMWHEQSWLS